MERTELEQKVWKLFEEGLTDNEVLNALVTEQGEELTYMELRILRAEYEEEHPETVEEEPAEEPENLNEDEEGPGINIDAIKKPGALLSGTAELPSGIHVSWALDQMGRINLQPKGEAQPTQEDMQFFQEHLKDELQKRGGLM